MSRSTILILALIFTLAAADAADAQQTYVNPGASRFDPPLPQPPPGPKITIPAVPKIDELPDRNYVPTSPPPSFGERISRCLDDAAAADMGPNRRAEYSRNCANR